MLCKRCKSPLKCWNPQNTPFHIGTGTFFCKISWLGIQKSTEVIRQSCKPATTQINKQSTKLLLIRLYDNSPLWIQHPSPTCWKYPSLRSVPPAMSYRFSKACPFSEFWDQREIACVASVPLEQRKNRVSAFCPGEKWGERKNRKEESGGAIGPFFVLAKRGNPVLRSLPLCLFASLLYGNACHAGKKGNQGFDLTRYFRTLEAFISERAQDSRNP